MFKRSLILFSLSVAMLFGALAMPAQAQTPTQGLLPDVTQAPVNTLECPICEVNMSTYRGPLAPIEVQGLLKALNDEYHAWAVYNQVIVEFGSVRPFTNVKSSEAKHISALVTLFKRYGLSVPANPWLDTTLDLASVRQACALGVDAEIANISLYDNLFTTTTRSDILTVYRSLRTASQTQHLTAFMRCA